MKHKEDIGIGDPIEVHFFKAPEMIEMRGIGVAPKRTQLTDGYDEWRPATVCSLGRDKIGAAFAGGIRMEIARHSNTWRVA